MLKIVRLHKIGHDDLEISSVGEKVFIKTGLGLDCQVVDLTRSEWDEVVETLK